VLAKANNDRAAGYARILELLHVELGRIAPPWAQVRDDVDGAPRLYVFASCRQLITQLKSAPIAADEQLAVEAVDKRWEGEHGHAVGGLEVRRDAATLALGRAAAAPPELEDPRQARASKRLK
jgi:hypothetical protein